MPGPGTFSAMTSLYNATCAGFMAQMLCLAWKLVYGICFFICEGTRVGTVIFSGTQGDAQMENGYCGQYYNRAQRKLLLLEGGAKGYYY